MENILDVSCSLDAAQRVLALFRDVSPITLRVRLDRWPVHEPTSNDEQFWVEVNGPCATDDLIWQLCYHLMQHPTDRAWEAYMLLDCEDLMRRSCQARLLRQQNTSLDQAQLQLPAPPARRLLVLPIFSGTLNADLISPWHIEGHELWGYGISLLWRMAAQNLANNQAGQVKWHVILTPCDMDRLNDLERQYPRGPQG